jgi:hypothetical protein
LKGAFTSTLLIEHWVLNINSLKKLLLVNSSLKS